MDDVRYLLRECSLEHYATTFEALGYNDVIRFLDMTGVEYHHLAQVAGMSHLEVLRLSVKVRDIIQEFDQPWSKSPVADEANAAAGHMEGTNVAGHIEGTSKGPEIPSFKTFPELKIWSLKHSTLQNCSAMVDVRNSGSRSKVYRCRSVLSEKVIDLTDDDPILCPYVLHWNFAKKRGTWKLNRVRSCLVHVPHCPSGQYVTASALAQDEQFIKHVNTSKAVSSKSAAHAALGGASGLMDGSIPRYTAWRAVKRVRQTTDKDYDDDWSKLAQWGRSFESTNPGSRFDCEADDENRFVPHSFVPRGGTSCQAPLCPATMHACTFATS